MYHVDLPPIKHSAQIEVMRLRKDAVNDIHIINEIDFEQDRSEILDILNNLKYYPNPETEPQGFRDIWILGIESKRLILKASISPHKYAVGYSPNHMFECIYSKQDQGTISIDAYLKDLQGNRHPYMPHLKDLISISVGYFTRMDLSVNVIDGSWAKPDKDFEATNFVAYHKALTQGLTPHEATFETPTGKAAGKLGFTHTSFLSKPTSKQGIHVLFSRTPLT